MEQKFKKGDKVRIIKYGSKIWYNKKEYAKQAAFYLVYQKTFESRLWYNDNIINYPVLLDENVKPNNILSENDDIYVCDLRPQLVGLDGIVEGSYADLSELNHWGSIRDEKNQREYSLSGINGKSAWYDEEQLELIV